jgi:hypothetical protein
MKKHPTLRRTGPDHLTAELLTAFAGDASFEFKSLFLVIHANLRARNAAHGGEDMLRLRLYEKLQNLVQAGGVQKDGKSYRGHAARLSALTVEYAALNSARAALATPAAAAALPSA